MRPEREGERNKIKTCMLLLPTELPIPRYVRVNLVRTTVDDVIAAFTADGWAWQERLNLGSFQNAVESLGQERFARDPLLFDVLIFPPGTDLHDHPLTSAGDIVLQDRVCVCVCEWGVGVGETGLCVCIFVCE